MKNKEITVLDQEIHINKDDYFSLTDIAKYKNPEDPRFVIQNWMRRIDTIQYIGLWEQLNNPNFNRVEFDTFRSEAGHNYFTMTPKKWIDGVNAIGIISKAGKYNGGHTHTRILLFNSHLGFRPKSTYILSKNSKDSKRTSKSNSDGR